MNTKSPNHFINGYFTTRLEAGETPDIKEPRSSLPNVPPEATMEIVTGFMDSHRRER